MRPSTFLLPLIVLLSVLIAGVLYLFGGPEVNTPPATVETPSGLTYAVAAEGSDAFGMDRRVNYRIRTEDEFASLWGEMFMGEGGALPEVNFAREEVLAVFNGTHSTTGHAVTVTDIKDADGVRSVTIMRSMPGDACTVATQITSPYVLIRVSKSSLPIQRIEQETVAACQ